MPYLALDDKFCNNPKIVGLSHAAFHLHVAALCYCSAHLTDGFVPSLSKVWRNLGHNQRLSSTLVSAGLWEKVEGGWVIHDYLEWNASAAQIKAKRRKDRERKRAQSYPNSARNPRGGRGGVAADSAGSAPTEPSYEGSVPGGLAKSARPGDKSRPWECHICSVGFRSERALNDHRYNVHDLAPL